MKAIEYVGLYKKRISAELKMAGMGSCFELFDDVYEDILTLNESRHARTPAARVAVVREVNQKWNKVLELLEKEIGKVPLKKDAVINKFRRENSFFGEFETLQREKGKILYMPEKKPELFTTVGFQFGDDAEEKTVKLPASDVEPVVRCGECQNSRIADGATEMRCSYLQLCRVGDGAVVHPNDKCHLPERVESAHVERSGSGE